jgi:hypothetical protein
MAEYRNEHIPLAYLITFRAYGTWLHGDKRGSVNRFHNRFGTPFIAPSVYRRLDPDATAPGSVFVDPPGQTFCCGSAEGRRSDAQIHKNRERIATGYRVD